MKPKLATIREKIMSTDIMEEVIENLENFINTEKARSGGTNISYAVRSSGTMYECICVVDTILY